MTYRLIALTVLLIPACGAAPEFEPNRGQSVSSSQFLARLGALETHIHPTHIRFVSPGQPAVQLHLNGLRPTEWIGRNPTGNIIRYCNLSQRDLCRTGVPTYAKLEQHAIYPGIDWILHTRGDHLEYDFLVHPHADPSRIRLTITGATGRLNDDGSLSAGPMLQWKPAAWQTIHGSQRPIAVQLQQAAPNEFVFQLGEYDTSSPLTIDPVIESARIDATPEEDQLIGVLGAYRYGTTRSAHWSRTGNRRDRDIFVKYVSTGTTTVFWGGTGDEEIGGADQESNNARLYLAGWTNSSDAPLLSIPGLHHRPFGGGTTDGFLIEFAHGGLSIATYIGGPGDDRLYDVRRIPQAGTQLLPLLIAGETSNTDWPNTTIERIGAGGKKDAFAGTLESERQSLLVIGGAGDDRAIRLRQVDAGEWAIGGETDSPDFPSTTGLAPSRQRDLWIARARFAPMQAPLVATYGGAGNESFGGLASIPDEGLYVAGTTDSANLPKATAPYKGGRTDGFLAHLDAATAAPIRSTYFGGNATDEITAMESYSGDLYLAGVTDSPSLALPGIDPEEAPAGRTDGLFVHCDSTATAMRAARVGGPGEDRILGLSVLEVGKVSLSGSSDAPEWLRTFDTVSESGAALDGFTLTFAFSTVRVVSPSTTGAAQPQRVTLTIGSDLQTTLSLQATSEPGMDGLLLIRSSDPSKLLVSESPDRPGREAILIQAGQQQTQFTLQALSAEGEVEVIVEGRAAPPVSLRYPKRTLRIQLAPSRIFLQQPSVSVSPGVNFNASVFTSPLLPNGLPGSPQVVRPGIVFDPSFDIPGGSGLSLVRQSGPRYENAGVVQIPLVASAEGSFTATPTSTRFAAAPDQILYVNSVNPQRSPFPLSNFQIPKDHVVTLPVSGITGDSIRAVSEDPARLRVGSARGMELDAVTLNPVSGAALLFTALSDSGTAAVRLDGIYNGQPFSARLLLRMVPYTARFAPSARPTISPGTPLNLTLETQPRWDASGIPFQFGATVALRSGVAVELRSSNPEVLQPVPNSPSGTFAFMARALGDAVLSFPPESPPEIASLTYAVRVVPPRISFGMDEIVLPTGGSQFIFIQESTVSFETIGTVRLRISNPALFALRTSFALEPAVNYPTGPASVSIVATGARPGDKATLLVSGQGFTEFGIPLRAVAPLFVPTSSELRYTAGESSTVAFLNAGDDNGRPISSLALRNERTIRLRVRAVPAGLCDFPETVEGQVELSVRFRCPNPAAVTVSLEPAGDVSPLQSSLTVRVVAAPAQLPPVLPVSRLLVGNRLQTALSLYMQSQFSTILFRGKLRSSDPSRLLISNDPKARGTAEVDTAASTRGEVYLQGFASEGTVQLIAESADGRSTTIPVFLFPSTIALRSGTSSSFSPGLISLREIEQPLGDQSFPVTARPYLVEPASGALIEQDVTIRGGTDPFFLRRESSDPAIVSPLPPDIIFNEGDSSGQFTFRATAEGLATLRAIQPEGFISVPDASLRVRVFARKLTLTGATLLLSPDLQVQLQAGTVSGSGGQTVSVPITVTSADPSKLLISTDPARPGQPSATVLINQSVHVQALSSVTPGERVTVQLSATNFATTDISFLIAPLALRRESQSPVELNLFTPVHVIPLIYGPVDGNDTASGAFSLRPGVTLPVQLSSSDTSILEPVSASIQPNSFLRIEVRPRRPGQAFLRVEAPPSVVNQAAGILVTVRPWEFSPYDSDPAARHLVSRFSVRNPSSGIVTATVSAANAAPLRFGTAQTGPNAPQASTLTVPLQPGVQRDLFVEPGAGANFGAIIVSAPDFRNGEISLNINEPGMSFDSQSPVLVSLTNRTFAVNLRLHIDGFSVARELPLGGSFGPLRVNLQSSNPQVVRVPAFVDFNPGDSRKSVTLELVGTGDSAVSLILPANFTRGTSRRDLLISVR
ncbi:MAG: hypothetical protein JST93_36125 [Acidobacteria bacterium]|nr:hypothetical protein [Acidobacteriota bacterium]